MEDKMVKFYYIDNDGGGGNAPTPPKGYAPLTVPQRTDWNNFLDYAGKANVDFDKNPQAAATLMAQYKKTNPNFSLSPNDIQRIQYEQYQLRKGDKFGNLTPEQLKYLRQGLPDTYLSRPIPEANGQFNGATAKLYYPQKTIGEKSYGTDIEGYVNSLNGQPATPPKTQKVLAPSPTAAPIPAAPEGPLPQGAIPRPNYADPKSRAAYLQQVVKKYGSVVHNRGDSIIHVNEVPSGGTIPVGESAKQAAKTVGLDPALLYSSAMEEGVSGLFPDKEGYIETGEWTNDKYPVDGFANYGLDNFHDNFKEMVKRGYLPKDLDYQKSVRTNEMGRKVNSALFKTPEDAMKAKAAYVKMEQDNLEDWTKKEGGGVQLSPTAKQFFTLIAFNGGPGRAHQLINYYKKKGLLEGDKFLSVKPDKSVDPKDSYGNVLPRVQIANLMRQEGFF